VLSRVKKKNASVPKKELELSLMVMEWKKMNPHEWADFCQKLQLVMANAYDTRYIASLHERVAYLEYENKILMKTTNQQVEMLVQEKETCVQQAALMLQQLERLGEQVEMLKRIHGETKHKLKEARVELERVHGERRKEKAKVVAMQKELEDLQACAEETRQAFEKDVTKRAQAMTEMRAFAKDCVRSRTETLMCNQELSMNLIKAANDLNYVQLLQERDHRDLRRLIEVWQNKGDMEAEIERIKREPFIISNK
jgi:chromosome segregation ATPase